MVVFAAGEPVEARASGEFIVIRISVTNNLGYDEYFAPMASVVLDSDGVAYPYAERHEVNIHLDTGQTWIDKVAAGRTFDGLLVADVPRDATIVTLQLSEFHAAPEVIEIDLGRV